MAQTVKFWFDPACPFAWITSRWIREVEQVRDIKVDFEVISLGVLNEKTQDQDDPDTKATWQGARTALAVRERHGAEKVSEFYTAAGTRIHNEGYGIQRYDDALKEALKEIGVHDANEIFEESKKDTYDEGLRESTRCALELVGDDVGTPIIAIGDSAFFGPVMTRIPRGEEAGKIWDGFATLVEYPYFYELKRARSTQPEFS
ncbi:MAG TPA: DsbA family protein [Enteractinococcus helveticum]|uniref:DsbA family protein n=1 Tax=Enteractinococcus helveticum TaxID=1837282 RepID=A0A921FNP1_9MICC|nr:DsbA family protein [Enteractinococcus helveticum]HJF15454.1 DsbA family protein [Enteractinococcus helveticum]